MIEQLISLLILLWLNAFLIIGVYTACQYDEYDGQVIEETKMVLWKVRYTIEKSLGKFWSKPLVSCPPCMASFHSIIPFSIWVASTGRVELFLVILLYIPALSGISKYLITKIES